MAVTENERDEDETTENDESYYQHPFYAEEYKLTGENVNKSTENYSLTPSVTYRVYALYFTVGRLQIVPSPVLAVTSEDGQTIYLTLDTGATCSVISRAMATRLNLKI